MDAAYGAVAISRFAPVSFDFLEIKGKRSSLLLSRTFAAGYALGAGRAGGWRYDAAINPREGQIVNRDATFHDISLYVGSTLELLGLR